jgi:hypothetical protein
MYQLLAICIFGACLSCARYLKGAGRVYLWSSAICSVAGILVSEVGLIVVPLTFLTGLICGSTMKQAARVTVPALAVALIFLGFLAWLHAHPSGNTYEGLRTEWNAGAMLKLWVKQVWAGFPLVDFKNAGAIPRMLFISLRDHPWLCAGFITALVFAARQSVSSVPTLRENKVVWAFLALLILLPAFIISPSSKYQQEVQWGSGYLPVYLQNFATATILCILLTHALHKPAGKYLLGLAVLAGVMVFLYSGARIDKRNFEHARPAAFLFESVKNGLLDSCSDNSLVYVHPNFFWKDPATYELIFERLCNKTLKVCEPPECANNTAYHDCYLLTCPPAQQLTASLFRLDCATKTDTILLQSMKE